MRAVVCRELGGPDALELADLPTPEPGACGVRIRVRAAGVNFADSLMLASRVDGVVLLQELEDDHVADVGLDVVGSVF